MSRMTANVLTKMQPGDKPIYDDQVPGLHARYSGGRVRFYLYFRTPDRQERRPKVGDYGVITLPQAREIARDWLFKNAKGEAVKPRLTALEKFTVIDLHERWAKEHRPKLKPQTQRSMDIYWKKYILPALGSQRVATLERKHIAEMISGIAAKHPTQANRVQAVISKALQLAEQWEIRQPMSNPCRTISRQKETARTRYLTIEEMQRFGAVLARWDDLSTWHRRCSHFFRMLLLTGARKGEIMTARREWVDYEKGILKLPDSKTGAKDVPLSATAIKHIQLMNKEAPNSPWICPGRKPYKQMKAHYKAWEELLDEAKIDDFRIHDLRHTFASVAISSGMDIKQVGEMLGHKDPTCTHRYTHLMAHRKSELADTVSGAIERMMIPRAEALADTGELGIVD